MTQANTARRDGDAFQARQFWLRAGRLLDSESPIIRVGFESGPKSFDDIWVEYESGRSPRDVDGTSLWREHMQCKWHVSPGSYGYQDLADPAFINANARSLLQRARAAQLAHAPTGNRIRFTLLTNWQLNQNDPLRNAIGTRSGALRVERLFDTKTDNSMTGAIRKSWREHLEIDEDGLRHFAGTLAFGAAVDSLDSYREQLDLLFGYVGLRRIPANESAFPYDDLVFQWLAQGSLEFDRATFRQICANEGLLTDGKKRPVVYGVKSFTHPVDRLEDRCVHVLDFVPEFDERYIRDEAEWAKTLYPALKTFLLQAAQENERPRLVLDAHATLAFAAGSVLNLKSGRIAEIEQRSPTRKVWAADDAPLDPAWSAWQPEYVEIDVNRPELAVAVAVTHDIAGDITAFIERSLPQVGRLMIFRPTVGAGPNAIANGRHAFELARTLAATVKSSGTPASGTMIHLFLAGPNALAFYLGQQQPVMGRTCLYEFDFDGGRDRSYRPSLVLPVAS